MSILTINLQKKQINLPFFIEIIDIHSSMLIIHGNDFQRPFAFDTSLLT
jgi:hypothetical protein